MDQLTLLLVGVLVALAIVGVVWLHFGDSSAPKPPSQHDQQRQGKDYPG